MIVLGLSCHYHDAAACLYRDGRLVAAAQEERFCRRKAAADFPILAINSCLQQEGLTSLDLDGVAFYEKPYLKFSRAILTHIRDWPFSFSSYNRSMPEWLSRRLTMPLDIATALSYDGEVSFIKHHLAHAASAFLPSPFTEAAILTADGLGEWATTSLAIGRGNDIEMLEELHYPDSLGLVYSAVTSYLGFAANSDEGRVMALSDFGEPRHLERFREIVEVRDDGSFKVDDRYFGFQRGRFMFSRKFERAFGPRREVGGPIEDRHRDVASSLQQHLEETLLKIACHAHERTGMKRLCAAGGVFLNCVSNSRILDETPFEELFIQPAAGDAGGALGAAACLSHTVHREPRGEGMTGARLGPEYATAEMRRCLVNAGLAFREMSEQELAAEVARLIADQRIVGWFQGRMEFGPRALGGRSILADPRNPDMKDLLNARVKHRESFRPYGVCVQSDRVSEYFEFEGSSPFMLLVGRARPELAERIPSALHVDGTSRLQTVTPKEDGLTYRVIEEFRVRTGVPLVINTSFNDHGEPVVCSPEDACACFLGTEIDDLAMGPFLVSKERP